MADPVLVSLIAEALNDHLNEHVAGVVFPSVLADALAEHVVLRDSLELAGYECSHDGLHKANDANWCAIGCGRDYNRMSPVFRVRSESVNETTEEGER